MSPKYYICEPHYLWCGVLYHQDIAEFYVEMCSEPLLLEVFIFMNVVIGHTQRKQVSIRDGQQKCIFACQASQQGSLWP